MPKIASHWLFLATLERDGSNQIKKAMELEYFNNSIVQWLNNELLGKAHKAKERIERIRFRYGF